MKKKNFKNLKKEAKSDFATSLEGIPTRRRNMYGI
jgi:hypothetical protein